MNLADIPRNTKELYVDEDMMRLVLAPEEIVSNKVHEVVKSRLKKLAAQFEESENIDHGTTKGGMRESYILNFFPIFDTPFPGAADFKELPASCT